MKTLIWAVCVWVMATVSLAAFTHPVTAKLVPSQAKISPGQTTDVSVQLDIEEGWHVYGQNPGEAGMPTRVTWTYDDKKLAITSHPWPQEKAFDLAGVASMGYEGRVLLPFQLQVLDNPTSVTIVPYQVKVSWIACRETCIPGSAILTDQVVLSDGPTVGSTHSVSSSRPYLQLIGMALAAFLGGLLLNVMPCVFPVLSLKVFQILNHRDRRDFRQEMIAYATGVLVSFWVMAGVLLGVKSVVGVAGWGTQLQHAGVVFGLMTLFLVLALSFFGVFELGVFLQRFGAVSGSRLSASFLSGVLMTVVAAPCTAPFLGAAIGFALGQSFVGAWIIFTAMGVGLSAPMCFLALFPEVARFLPRPGAWMTQLRQFLGFPMLGTVLWLFWVFQQQRPGTFWVMWVLLAVAICLWFVGMCQRAGAVKWGMGLLVVGVGIALWATYHVSFEQRSPVSVASPKDSFLPFSEEILQEARLSGKPVFVEVTAAWCLTCQVTKKRVLETDTAQMLFAKSGVVLLRADWTNQDERITRYLASFGRNGVPLYVYYPPHGEPALLPEWLRIEDLKEALKK